MAVASLGHDDNALPQQSRYCFVLAGKQICHAEEVKLLVIRTRIQTHGALDHWYRLQRLSRVAGNAAKNVVGHSEIRIERQPYVDLGLRPIEYPTSHAMVFASLLAAAWHQPPA
jgi:hypothetical protein